MNSELREKIEQVADLTKAFDDLFIRVRIINELPVLLFQSPATIFQYPGEYVEPICIKAEAWTFETPITKRRGFRVRFITGAQLMIDRIGIQLDARTALIRKWSATLSPADKHVVEFSDPRRLDEGDTIDRFFVEERTDIGERTPYATGS